MGGQYCMYDNTYSKENLIFCQVKLGNNLLTVDNDIALVQSK